MKDKKSELLLKHWDDIRDGIILDLKLIDPEKIETFTLTRGLHTLKVDIVWKTVEAKET